MSINDAISNAQDGMVQVSRKLTGIGENVANLNTTGFRKQRFINVLDGVPDNNDQSSALKSTVQEQRVFQVEGELVSTGMETDFGTTGHTMLVARLNDSYYATHSGSVDYFNNNLSFGQDMVLQVIQEGELKDWFVDVNETLDIAASTEINTSGILSDNGLSVGDSISGSSVLLYTDQEAIRVFPTFILTENRQWQWFLADEQGNRLSVLNTFNVDALDRPVEGASGRITIAHPSIFEPTTLNLQQFQLGDVISSDNSFFMLEGELGAQTVETIALGLNEDGLLIDTLTGLAVLFQSSDTGFETRDVTDVLISLTEMTTTISLTGVMGQIDSIGEDLDDPIVVDVVADDDSIQAMNIRLSRVANNEYSVSVEVNNSVLTVLGTLVTDASGVITADSRTIRAVGQGFDFNLVFGTDSESVSFGEDEALEVVADGAIAGDPDLLILSESGELSSIVSGQEQTVGFLQLGAAPRQDVLTIDFDLSMLQLSSNVLNSSIISEANGRGEARFESIQVNADGKASIIFSDGTERNSGTIALVDHQNVYPESSDGVWFKVDGDASTIVRNSHTLYAQGETVRQGMLERSNVDLTGEFSELILAQRGYQALSQVMTVGDKMLETLLRDT